MANDIKPWEAYGASTATSSEGPKPWEEYSGGNTTVTEEDPLKELGNMPLHRQAMSGAVGGFEALGSAASTPIGLAAGGGRLLGSLATGDSFEEASGKMAETQHKYTYEPKSTAGKAFAKLGGEGYDKLKEQASKNLPIGPMGQMIDKAMRARYPDYERGADTMGEALFDVGANALPVAEMTPKRRPGVKTPKPDIEQKPWEAYQQQDMLEQPDPMGSEYNASPIDQQAQNMAHPDVRDQMTVQNGMLNPERRAQLEQELNPPVDQRQQGQGELFTDHARDDLLMGEGGVGARDAIPGPDLEARGVRRGEFHPELTDTEYSGPRQQGEPTDNSVNYKQYDPNRIADQVIASEKPGFMRSAEEVMRAKELEKAEEGPSAGLLPKNFSKNDALSKVLEKTNNVRAGIEHISRKSQVPYYKELAKKLLDDPEFRPDLKIASPEKDSFGRELAGLYEGKSHKIILDPRTTSSEYLLLHESVHARTVQALHAYERKLAGSEAGIKNWDLHFKHLEAPTKRIYELFHSLEDSLNSQRYDLGADHPLSQANKSYGMQDVKEFVAEGFTNPTFQSHLAQLKLPKELQKGGLKYYWDAFVNSVKDMLGMTGKDGTYLSELLHAGSELMSKTSKDNSIYYADMLDPVGNYGARLDKQAQRDRGPMGAMKEAAREYGLDKRKIEQVIEQDLPEGKKLQDLTAKTSNQLWQSVLDTGTLVKTNLLQDRTLATVMKDKAGTGPIFKWVTDQVSMIERKNINKAKEALDLGLNKYRRLYNDRTGGGRADLVEAVKKWDENISERDLSRADFKNDRQWEMYRDQQAVFDRVLKDVNKQRTSSTDVEGNPLRAINRIPSYFPAMWRGDYRIFGYDGMGNKVFAEAFNNKWEAHSWRKEYEKAHPNVKISDVEQARKDKYSLDIESFNEAIKVMGSDNPITKAMIQTKMEILQRRGFGRTGVYRKGILGFMGSEGGELGLRLREKAFDQYVNMAYRYIGNLEKQKVLADLQKIPEKTRKELPETMDFAESYIRKTQGAKLGEMAWDGFFTGMSKALGFGENGPLRAVRMMSQIASLYWLFTPRFLISQAPQSLNALPKLVQEHGIKDGYKMYFDGLQHSMFPDKVGLEAKDWAAKQGYLNPTIKSLISHDFVEHPTSKWQYLREGTSLPAAKVEQMLVRYPVFMMFEKALRESIPNKEKRFEVAGEKMDYYMVNYGRSHQAMIYDKAGLAGEAARPLKSYSHNTWGQFFEYVKGVKDKQEYAPLAHFLGVQAAVGGLKGVMLAAEATAIITLINGIFGLDLDTPERLLMKTSLPDWMIWGGLSTALGGDVSASVNAPSFPAMFSFPPIEFTKNMVVDVGNYLIKKSQGIDDDRDRLRASLAISPNLMREYLRNLWTPSGEPVVNPNDPQLRGNYRRSEAEQTMTSLFGVKPMEEAKIDAMVRATKQELVLDANRKMNALDAIADKIQQGQAPDQALIERYMKDGGDPSRLSENVVKRVRDRMMTYPERTEMAKTMSIGQIHKLETMQQYLDNLIKAAPNDPNVFNPETGEITHR